MKEAFCRMTASELFCDFDGTNFLILWSLKKKVPP